MIRDASLHRGGNSQRLMNAAEVVVHHVQGDRLHRAFETPDPNVVSTPLVAFVPPCPLPALKASVRKS
jgi:hypothetical protein